MRLAIVIPVCNDARQLESLLSQLVRLERSARTACAFSVVVVDGGSRDDSVAVATRAPVVNRVIEVGIANRGLQLDTGVEACAGQADWIWFLHADSWLQPELLEYLQTSRPPGWGRFDVRIEGSELTTPGGAAVFNLISNMMNWRSRLTAICTGDQAMFVHVQLLEAVGGVPHQPLMEDIELSRRLKRLSRPCCPRLQVGTSARRWERNGPLTTILAMWRWRWRYWRGVDPVVLAGQYYGDD